MGDVVQQAMQNFSIEPIKEPRGFIRLIQFILSIFAFATTTSVNSVLQFRANCKGEFKYNVEESVQVAYPFDIEHEMYTIPLCRNDTVVQNRNLIQGSKASAEFYVFVGVIVFLYCIASVVIYLFFDELYRRNNVWSIVDFVTTGLFGVLWLISSSAWAQGVVNLKYYTDLKECGVFDSIPDCNTHTCTQTKFPNFASLNVSIIFGFLNMVVWFGNLWFLYKETPWFKASQEQTGGNQAAGSPKQEMPPSDPSRI